MAYRIQYRPAAVRDLKRLDPPIRRRVISVIEALALDPRPPGVQLLAGSDLRLYRLRVGDYRIIYTVRTKAPREVLIVRIGHRREIYRSL